MAYTIITIYYHKSYILNNYLQHSESSVYLYHIQNITILFQGFLMTYKLRHSIKNAPLCVI